MHLVGFYYRKSSIYLKCTSIIGLMFKFHNHQIFQRSFRHMWDRCVHHKPKTRSFFFYYEACEEKLNLPRERYEEVWGSCRITPLILNFDAREMSGQFYSLSSYPRRKSTRNPLKRRLDRLQSHSGGAGENKNVSHRKPNHDSSVTRPFA